MALQYANHNTTDGRGVDGVGDDEAGWNSDDGFRRHVGSTKRVKLAVDEAAAARPRIAPYGSRKRVRFTYEETRELQRLVALHGTGREYIRRAAMDRCSKPAL